MKESQEKVRHLNNQHRKDRDEWQTTENDLENKLRTETKKRERMEKENDQEKRQKDQEIIGLKDKIFQLEREQRRASVKLVYLIHLKFCHFDLNSRYRTNWMTSSLRTKAELKS